jgi:hypothetical protein
VILLDTSRIPKLDRLKKPPTHANLGSVLHTHMPYAKLGQVSITVNYHYGTVDAAGVFDPDPECGTIVANIPEAPHPGSDTVIPSAWHNKLLENLFAKDAAPHPERPLDPIAAKGKPAGEFRRSDIDAIMANAHPELLGKVV